MVYALAGVKTCGRCGTARCSVNATRIRQCLDKRADPKAPIPYAKLGDSSALQVGDPVISMGNPMMLSSSLTLGVVSNTKRVFTDFTGTQIEERAYAEVRPYVGTYIYVDEYKVN